jgi:hypothetical protein
VKTNLHLFLCLTLIAFAGNTAVAAGKKPPKGLNPQAEQELRDAGVDKYVGQFSPISSTDVGDGWTKHTFDRDFGNGPICIAGTEFSAFTRAGKSDKLLIMEQGGGACWQGFYFCNVLSEAQEPPAAPFGIWDFDAPENPFADYSIVYMPYCDGSTFAGDNDVYDPAFAAWLGVPQAFVRFHRGLRNMTAGMDLAKATFPKAKRITVAGSSAGGVGASSFSPFLARMLYGNKAHLTVFNDAGPVAINLNETEAIAARAADWQFGKFFPASCTECDDMGQSTATIDWRLENDSTIREAFYETDGDATNRFFMNIPTQWEYRQLILTEHGALNDAHPDRYKRFIVSGDDSHTALQTPLFYLQEANGVPLNEWTAAFLKSQKSKKSHKSKKGHKSHKSKKSKKAWNDIVEDFVPLP